MPGDWLIWSAVPMVLTATGTVWMGAMRAREVRRVVKDNSGLQEGGATDSQSPGGGGGMGQHATVLDARGALMMPVMGSVVLIVLYFLFSQLQALIVGYMLLASYASCTFALHTPLRALLTRLGVVVRRGVVSWLGAGISLVLLLSWLYSGHWVLNNVIGVCLCVSMVAFIALPNLRVAALCLGSLFVYDIFWVFGSASVFGANVMVEVATKAADNPALSLGKALHLPFYSHAIPSLQLPLKLLFPYLHSSGAPAFSMLGLGDMAIPGLFVSLALHLDDYLSMSNQHTTHHHDEEEGEGAGLLSLTTHIKSSDTNRRGVGYFGVSLIGYVVGLLMSIACSHLFEAAQPALLYLVPCVLGPIVSKAVRGGHLRLLWGGWGEGKEEMKGMGGGREGTGMGMYKGIEGGPQCAGVGGGNRPRWSLEGKKGLGGEGEGESNLAMHSFHHRKADVC